MKKPLPALCNSCNSCNSQRFESVLHELHGAACWETGVVVLYKFKALHCWWIPRYGSLSEVSGALQAGER
jgi:hypothetical protein